MSGNQLMTILSPVIGIIFIVFLIPLWMRNASRTYILYFIGSFALYTLASGAQIVLVPGSAGPAAVLPAILYFLCIAVLIEGCLSRQSRGSNLIVTGVILAVTLIGTLYYHLIGNSFIARVYILSAGCGLLFGAAAFRLRPSPSERTVDKIIFWLFLLMGLQIFLRPILTLGLGDKAIDPATFAESSFWLIFHFTLVVSGVLMGLTLLSAIVIDITADLKNQSAMDALTGIYNRRGFDERASAVLERGNFTPFNLVVCDIDHFKSINDAHGHPTGDRILKEFSALLIANVRKNDIVGRIGGEEFAVLLTECTPEGAQSFSERVRALFEAYGTEILRGASMTTASFGVAVHRPGETLHQLMLRADQLLYDAKKTGRNRVCSDSDAIGGLAVA